jgi:hypothetical protein
MTVDELAAALRTLEAAITTARQAVAGAALVDLTGLEEEVERLCTACAAVPAEARADVAFRLAAIIGALDALAADLVADREESRRIAEDLARRRAAGAYGRPQER